MNWFYDGCFEAGQTGCAFYEPTVDEMKQKMDGIPPNSTLTFGETSVLSSPCRTGLTLRAFRGQASQDQVVLSLYRFQKDYRFTSTLCSIVPAFLRIHSGCHREFYPLPRSTFIMKSCDGLPGHLAFRVPVAYRWPRCVEGLDYDRQMLG